ncbi:MAG: VWA domain-containing protein [Oscillospiraceae bacterium]|nr:VWA domain-containing protein [Oscillospiraceae bacterium]
MKKYISLFAAAAVVLSLAGCASNNSSRDPSGALNGGGSYGATDIGGAPSKSGHGLSGIFGSKEGAADMDVLGETFGALGDGAAPTMSAAPGDHISTEEYIGEPSNSVSPQSGLLTGGEWNDNAHWTDWQKLYESREEWASFKNAWKNGADCRIAVKVTADGKPLEGAKVTCEGCINSAVTDNKGMAYLFYTEIDGQTNPITVSCGNVTKQLDGVFGSAQVEADLSGAVSPINKKLDLMIMCDTTGSMGDELEYLKVELEDIVNKIQAQNSNIPTRVSVNFYRDEGDEYVVRQFPFSDNINNVVKAIREQKAMGGGDFPEAVHTALDSAVNNHDWDEDSVKIMFLVLDAPPHEDAQIVDSVNKYISQAAEKGIRVIPVASSGIDKSTEYLLRTFAFTTGGTYTFLTDHSGIGGEHIEATVGAYNVEKLNDMMVRIVKSYLE